MSFIFVICICKGIAGTYLYIFFSLFSFYLPGYITFSYQKQIIGSENPRDLVTNELDGCFHVSSSSSHATIFTFGLIELRKAWTPLFR